MRSNLALAPPVADHKIRRCNAPGRQTPWAQPWQSFYAAFRGIHSPAPWIRADRRYIMLQKRLLFVIFSILLAAAAFSAGAQVVPSAYSDRRISVTVGGMGSIFQPDYEGASITTLFPPHTYVRYLARIASRQHKTANIPSSAWAPMWM